MNTGRINEWYFTHTYDPYFGTVAQFGHDFLKLGSDTKEVGTVDFIYFHTFGNHEMFFVHFQIGFIIGVDFILITDISVVSMTRFMNNTQAMSKPTSIATVKSKITVKKKVINSTVTSDFGFFSNALKVRQPLML